MYDNVYESVDAPPDWVIEDDKLLEEWFEVVTKEYNERREKNYREKMKGTTNMVSAFKAEEVIVIDRSKPKGAVDLGREG
jgi:hypothetical protein